MAEAPGFSEKWRHYPAQTVGQSTDHMTKAAGRVSGSASEGRCLLATRPEEDENMLKNAQPSGLQKLYIQQSFEDLDKRSPSHRERA